MRLPGPAWAMMAAVSLAALAARPAGAQELEGVALGPDGEPLVGVAVLLHRVDAAGGAMVGTDTTGANGEFSFAVAAGDSAVYFAALRYEGELYVGPAAQPAGGPVAGYVLQVGPESEIGAMASSLGGGGLPSGPAQTGPTVGGSAGSSDAGALWLVALLALAAAAAFVLTAPRYRRRRTRDALIEVAKIENRLADTSVTLAPEERARLEARHDQLKEQLAPGA